MLPDISPEKADIDGLKDSFGRDHSFEMAITAILRIGLLFHANRVEESVAVDTQEGGIVLGQNFALVGAQTLRFSYKIFTLLIDFIITSV